jgi:hypothetical protein
VLGEIPTTLAVARIVRLLAISRAYGRRSSTLFRWDAGVPVRSLNVREHDLHR